MQPIRCRTKVDGVLPSSFPRSMIVLTLSFHRPRVIHSFIVIGFGYCIGIGMDSWWGFVQTGRSSVALNYTHKEGSRLQKR